MKLSADVSTYAVEAQPVPQGRNKQQLKIRQKGAQKRQGRMGHNKGTARTSAGRASTDGPLKSEQEPSAPVNEMLSHSTDHLVVDDKDKDEMEVLWRRKANRRRRTHQGGRAESRGGPSEQDTPTPASRAVTLDACRTPKRSR